MIYFLLILIPEFHDPMPALLYVHFVKICYPQTIVNQHPQTAITFMVMFEVNGRVIAVRLREHKEKAAYDH